MALDTEEEPRRKKDERTGVGRRAGLQRLGPGCWPAAMLPWAAVASSWAGGAGYWALGGAYRAKC